MAKSKKTEFDLFAFFEMTPDLVCIVGKDGFFKKVNPAVIDKLGYSEKELFASPVASFIYPEDKELTKQGRTGLLSGKALLNFENRYLKRNGEIVWLEWTSIYLPDKEIVFAIAKDISERKLIESEVEEKYKKFKGLATHFKASLEEERKYLATELHEELAQLAAVVKMDIEWLDTHVTDLSGPLKNRMEHALAISDLLINTIRRISFSISPHMLEDLGLNTTLEWHCKEFSILNGIPCSFKSAYEEDDLTAEIKLDFFRICQESLTNVMYHAQANKVTIRIEDKDDQIILTIVDDGKGFDIDQQTKTAGLITMRELASSINARLVIQSETGKGTSVSVILDK